MKSANPPEQAALIPAIPQALERPINQSAGLSIEQVFQAVIEKNVSPENIQVMKELLAMAAEQKFANAFVALQQDLPVIVAKSVIPNRGKYQKFEDVMDEIQPFLTKHGFTVSFSMDFKDNRVLEICHLTHGGFTRSNSFAVRTRKADNDSQSDVMAATTAKRNALCNALNIVIRQDCLNEEHDAGIEGDPNAKVSPEVAEELEHRVAMTNSDKAKFLAYAGADKFSNILESKYAMLDASLKRRETQGR